VVSVDGLTKDEKMVLLSMTNGFMSLGNFPVGLLEIRRMTGMSTTALAQALRKLIRKGVVERTSCNRYKLTDKEKQLLLIALGPFFNDYLLEKAERVSKEISRFKTVEGVFLLGSLAQGRGSYDSDIDLLIILGHQNESLERRISNVISKLSLQLGVPVEPSFLSVKGARDHQRIQASPELRPQGGLPLFERSHKLHQREKKRSKGWGDKLLGGEKIAVFLSGGGAPEGRGIRPRTRYFS